MINQTLKAVKTVLVVLLASSALVGCGSGFRAEATATLQQLQPVDDEVAAKAQRSCWFRVTNKSSAADEMRLWAASAPLTPTVGRLGDLVIVTGALEPAVHDARYYGCALFEYQPGTPVVLSATTGTNPVRSDNVVPYGFAKDGRKEL